MAIREGNSRSTQPKGRASSVSPRYQLGTRPPETGGSRPILTRFPDPSRRGLLALCGSRRTCPLVPFTTGRQLLVFESVSVTLFNGVRALGTSHSPVGGRLLHLPHSCSRRSYELISKS